MDTPVVLRRRVGDGQEVLAFERDLLAVPVSALRSA